MLINHKVWLHIKGKWGLNNINDGCVPFSFVVMLWGSATAERNVTNINITSAFCRERSATWLMLLPPTSTHSSDYSGLNIQTRLVFIDAECCVMVCYSQPSWTSAKSSNETSSSSSFLLWLVTFLSRYDKSTGFVKQSNLRTHVLFLCVCQTWCVAVLLCSIVHQADGCDAALEVH